MKKYIYILLSAYFVCFGHSTANAQLIINTIAGTGVAGYSGDGGPATAAQFGGVVYGAADGMGNIYISDQGNHRIRKISTSGIITTIAGTGTPGYSGDGGPASAAQINHPYGVAADAVGNIYITDYTNVIRKINSAGIISTIAGVGTVGFAGDGGPATAAKFNAPGGIKIDGSGNIYIADMGNCRIRKINSAGIITTVAGNGATTYAGDSGPATSASIWQPTDIAVDAAGNLYIADMNNYRIRKVSTSGIITTIAGTGLSGYSGDGGPATSAKINLAMSVAFDASGNLIIGDYLNSRVRMVDISGTITTISGTGVGGYAGDHCAAVDAQVAFWSIFTDMLGNVYLPASRIRKIYPGNAPAFFGGTTQTTSVCMDSTLNLNYLLTVIDADTIQTETWSTVMAPVHGVLSASYTTTSSGGMLIPTGLSYTPATGYTGADSFTVKVLDCAGAVGTTTVYVSVQNAPTTGDITPADSVCPGYTASFSGGTAGGTWSSSNTSVATISTSGVVSGIAPGTCTISYTVSNSCGSVYALFPFSVKPFSACADGNGILSGNNREAISISPNPIKDGQFIAYITSFANEDVRISITNLLGKKITEVLSKTNTTTYLRPDCPPGMYLLTATTSHNTFSMKVLCQQ